MLLQKIIPVNWDENRQANGEVEAAVKEGLYETSLPINLSRREKKSVHVHGDEAGYYQDKKQRVRFQIRSDFHVAVFSDDAKVVSEGGAAASLVHDGSCLSTALQIPKSRR